MGLLYCAVSGLDGFVGVFFEMRGGFYYFGVSEICKGVDGVGERGRDNGKSDS